MATVGYGELTPKISKSEQSSFSSEMKVTKHSAAPNLEVRLVESAIKRWLCSELEERVFSLTHELFMPKH